MKESTEGKTTIIWAQPPRDWMKELSDAKLTGTDDYLFGFAQNFFQSSNIQIPIASFKDGMYWTNFSAEAPDRGSPQWKIFIKARRGNETVTVGEISVWRHTDTLCRAKMRIIRNEVEEFFNQLAKGILEQFGDQQAGIDTEMAQAQSQASGVGDAQATDATPGKRAIHPEKQKNLDTVRELWSQGYRLREISEKSKIPEGTVKALLREQGLRLR